MLVRSCLSLLASLLPYQAAATDLIGFFQEFQDPLDSPWGAPPPVVDVAAGDPPCLPESPGCAAWYLEFCQTSAQGAQLVPCCT